MTNRQPVLLLEREAARILRCSTTTIKRLRLSGQLAYIPGRPVRIEESELAAYIARLRVPTTREPEPEPAAPKITTVEKQDDASRARNYWLRRRLR
jgi:excisionase family DNA binding protein